ncbi:phage tail protein [Paraburkholderia sp. SIMBA_054]|uniref:phage tail protein n=1 Tax=Paraburkholderia sp. SIMBA_054 TaxID=3085795 RepID=UPI00397DE6F7
MATRTDPLRNFRFRLEIAGITEAGFSEVTVADTTTDAIDYREGRDPPHLRKLSGLTKFANVTLKWGMTDSMDLYQWHADTVEKGSIANRKTVVVVVIDEGGADKARFVVSNAWPIKYTPGALNGKGNDVMIETLELANEGIERQKA